MGCQATPEKEIVMNKGQQYLQPQQAEVQKKDMDIPQNSDTYIYEERISDQIQSPSVEIIVDAEVIGPEQTCFDVRECLPRKFSKDELESTIQFFFPDAEMYEQDFEPALTKGQIEERIISIKQAIANIDAEPKTPQKRQELLEEYQSSLDALEEAYPKAPSEVEQQPFSIEKLMENGEAMLKFRDKITGENQGSGIIVTNEYENMRANTMLLARGNISDVIGHTGEWDEQSAIKTCDDIIAKLGFSDFQRFHTSFIVDGEGKSRYETVYTRVEHGIRNNYALESKENPDVNAQFSFYWQPEYIILNIDSYDNCRMEYCSPSADGEILSEKAELVPFNDLMEKMRTGLLAKTAHLDDGIVKSRIVINKIQFGTMRISRADTIDQYITVPVWDFYGNESVIADYEENTAELAEIDELKEEETLNSYLTINALDGSIIDRTVGY